jgi:hypothetical protein
MELTGQADCAFQFKYIGTIICDSNEIEAVGLPTTSYLEGYANKREEKSFYKSTLVNCEIKQDMFSSGISQYYCSFDNIINNVFKKDRKGIIIKVYLRNPKKVIEKRIPIELITFKNDTLAHKIVVDLGKIIK